MTIRRIEQPIKGVIKIFARNINRYYKDQEDKIRDSENMEQVNNNHRIKTLLFYYNFMQTKL